jgi:hypothetical protein
MYRALVTTTYALFNWDKAPCVQVSRPKLQTHRVGCIARTFGRSPHALAARCAAGPTRSSGAPVLAQGGAAPRAALARRTSSEARTYTGGCEGAEACLETSKMACCCSWSLNPLALMAFTYAGSICCVSGSRLFSEIS